MAARVVPTREAAAMAGSSPVRAESEHLAPGISSGPLGESSGGLSGGYEDVIDWATFPAPSPEEAAREIAAMRARWLETDHAEALRDDYAWRLEREDPEGWDRERRADRREAQQLADAAERRR